MRVLIATDAFPPVSGGSGWSAYELARGLRDRGHDVIIVQPRPGRVSDRTAEYDGFVVEEVGLACLDVPYIRNYLKTERAYSVFGRHLARRARAERADIVHGQHVITGPAAIRAARDAGIPGVCTVRDYWPVCYWSDLIHDPAATGLCPDCSASMMTTCVRPRSGAAWPLAVPLIPYMRANLRRKRAALTEADAIVAVSSTMAADLVERAPELGAARIEMIPNPLDAAAVREIVRNRPRPLAEPYVVYVGKLAVNKGVGKLLPALDRARIGWPLVVIGSGPERRAVEEAFRLAGREVRMLGWLPREEALAWMAHAAILAFPSHGPESLSRVLLEASALGVAIAAMDTGGTADIVLTGRTGLLSTTVEGFGDDLARLAGDPDLRAELGRAARARIDERFDASVVVTRIEKLYRDLIDRGRS